MPLRIDYTIFSKKNAIIIIPGIMGTELKLAVDTVGFPAGTIIWPPVGENDTVTPLTAPKIISKLQALSCDKEGKSVFPYVKINEDDTYGAYHQYKILYDYLKGEFKSEYEIIFYGYDWRMPNSNSASRLKLVAEEYDKITIVAHSMGGMVASHFLKNADIRHKVEKVITLGTPFLGSQNVLPILSHGDLDALDNALSGINPVAAKIAKEIVLKPLLRTLSANIPAIYEILPNKKYFSLDNRYYFIQKNKLGTHNMTTFDMTKAALKSVSGRFNIDLFNKATIENDGLWIGNIHTTSYVKSCYITGEGMDTGHYYTHDQLTVPDSYSITTTKSGDNSVLSYSASLNNLYPARSFFVISDHGGLIKYKGQTENIKGSSVTRPSILQFIKNLINGSTELTNGITRKPNHPL